MAKVYVVTAPERIRGIYASWPETAALVKGVSGARYQEVASRELAEAMLRGEGAELRAGLYGFVDGNHLGGVGVVVVDKNARGESAVRSVEGNIKALLPILFTQHHTAHRRSWGRADRRDRATTGTRPWAYGAG